MSRIPTQASAWVLLVVAPVCAMALIAVPRPLVPEVMPPLQLAAEPAAAAIAADAARLAHYTPDAEAAALDALWLQRGEADRAVVESMLRFEARQQALRAGLSALQARQGVEGVHGLRARALARVEAALRGNLPEAEIPAVMGGFANQLQRHGMLRGGRLLAPRIAVRALYKARWNLAHGLANDALMEPVEARALHGWLALHSPALSAQAKATAIDRFGQLEGAHAVEAMAVAMVKIGAPERAAGLFAQAHDAAGGQLRLRNLGLGALHLAGLLE